MKKLQIRLVAIILSLLIATTLLYHPVKVKAAVVAAPTAMQIASFIMSVTGAVDLISGGGVKAIAGSVRDQLAQTVSGLMGTGIYTDSEGNYVFSSDATKQIYDVLYNSSSMDIRVISSFYGLTPMAGLAYYGNPDFPITLKNYVNNNRTLYSSYLIGASVSTYENVKYGNVNIYDITNVAYFLCKNGQLLFYNSSGNQISVSYKRVRMKSDDSGGYTGYGNTTNTTVNSYSINGSVDGSATYVNVKAFYLLHDLDDTGIGTTDFTFSQFPFFNHEIDGSVFWSNRSLLIGKNVNELYSHYNNPGGIVCANDYTNLPGVSPSVINNNNWDSIYNNYVSNVSNNLQYFYNSENNTYNYEEMYKFLKTFNNNITNEVESNNNDIEQSINYNNTWLSMIYDTLRSIYVKLDNLSSGGGGSSCPWTETDIQNMLSSLTRLENSLSQDVTTNQQIFAYLATLNQSILSIASSNNPQTIYNEYNNYFAALDGLPDADVLDFIGKTDVIKALLPTVAPFGFIALGSAIISGLAADPVDPVFVMPLKFNHSLVGQTVNIDEEITIDLTPFNSARIVLNAFLVLVFLISLIFITIELIHRFVDILGG